MPSLFHLSISLTYLHLSLLLSHGLTQWSILCFPILLFYILIFYTPL